MQFPASDHTEFVRFLRYRYMDSGFGKLGWQLDKIDVYSLGVCICDLTMGCDASQFSQDLERARGDGIPGLSRPLQYLIKVALLMMIVSCSSL